MTVGPSSPASTTAPEPPQREADRPVALVTGASRGVGAGIAKALGEAGCAVYVTGRSTRDRIDPEALPGTIEDTAEAVTAAGGIGSAIACDHRDEAQIEAVIARIQAERGRLDILVNNAWGGYERHPGASFAGPFMAQPTHYWDDMFEGGLKATFLTTRHALRLMTGPTRGASQRLIVNTVAWAYDSYLGNLWYDVAKSAAIRMVKGLALELAGADIVAVALTPGFVRTERVEQALASDRAALARAESPLYAGRAVVTLAADTEAMDRSGKVWAVGDLARDYGLMDTDGRQPAGVRLG